MKKFEVNERVFWFDLNDVTKEMSPNGTIIEIDDYIRVQWDDGRLSTYRLNEPRLGSTTKAVKPVEQNKYAVKPDTSESFRRFAEIASRILSNNPDQEGLRNWVREDRYRDISEEFNRRSHRVMYNTYNERER